MSAGSPLWPGYYAATDEILKLDDFLVVVQLIRRPTTTEKINKQFLT